MTKKAKIVLGIATLWPLLYMFIFFAFVLLAAFAPNQSASFEIILLLHIFTILWMFALAAIYILNVFKNDHIIQEIKILWALLILFGNMATMPIYWYLYIWRDPPDRLERM
ncbi:MAG: hypothetical protein ACM3QW_04020 [Ignavibacteriales bacterium]